MKPRDHSSVPVWLGATTLILYAVICQRITPNAAIPATIRLDIVVLGLCGVASLFPMKRAGAAGTVLPPMRDIARILPEGRLQVRLAVSGALLGVAAVAPFVAVPWVLVAALAFAWAGRRGRRRARHRVLVLVVFLLAAGLNLAAVSAVMARGLRIAPNDFARLDLRVNTLLADVPIHDAWAIELESDGSATMEDLVAAMGRFRPYQGTPIMVVLGGVREILGRTFGWEDPKWEAEETSFVHRLSEDDLERSAVDPGTEWGRWRLLYNFPEEGAIETINGTVHLAVACAIENGASGSTLYLAFRVNEVNWSTPFYMRLIDPFRRYLFYPSLLRQFAHAWESGRVTPTPAGSAESETW